jgi:hypothetical protein
MKSDADKKKANFKSLSSGGATADNRNGQTAYLTAENLRVKVMVLADIGSDYSAMPHSAVEDARKRGFPLEVEVLPEPVMLNMAIRGESDSKSAVRRRFHVSGDNHYAFGASVHAWSATDHCRSEYGPSADRKAGLRRDGFRGESASGLHKGDFTSMTLVTLARSYRRWDKQTLGALSKLLLKFADISEFIEDLPDVLALAKKKNMKRREQAKLHALDEDQSEVQRAKLMTGTMTCYSST